MKKKDEKARAKTKIRKGYEEKRKQKKKKESCNFTPLDPFGSCLNFEPNQYIGRVGKVHRFGDNSPANVHERMQQGA